MAQHQAQHPIGRQSNVSMADSGMGISTHNDRSSSRQEQHRPEEKPLYDDLQSYIARKRRHWIFTRDVELAHPIQHRFLAYEADVMGEIHDIEREREIKHQQRSRQMQGATGIAGLSWKLYKLKARLCGRWRRYRLRGSWKHGRLDAKKKELGAEYVRAQIGSRVELLGEIISFANDEAVAEGDDGAYVRDGILNYIVTGYDSMFPIARDLEVDIGRTRGL